MSAAEWEDKQILDYMIVNYANFYKAAHGYLVEFQDICDLAPPFAAILQRLNIHVRPDYWNYDPHIIGGNESVKIRYMAHKHPERLAETISNVSRGMDSYEEYYRQGANTDFSGHIDILRDWQKEYVWSRIGGIYMRLVWLKNSRV